MAPRDVAICALFVDTLDALDEAASRTPGRQPAVAEPCGSVDGRVASSAHQEGDTLGRCRPDLAFGEPIELAVAIDRLAIE